MTREELEKAVNFLIEAASAKGQLVEMGWLSLRVAAYPPDMPAVQYNMLREVFFAGASHLFSSLMTIIDKGEEPTPADERKMLLLQDEMKEFLDDFKFRHNMKG